MASWKLLASRSKKSLAVTLIYPNGPPVQHHTACEPRTNHNPAFLTFCHCLFSKSFVHNSLSKISCSLKIHVFCLPSSHSKAEGLLCARDLCETHVQSAPTAVFVSGLKNARSVGDMTRWAGRKPTRECWKAGTPFGDASSRQERVLEELGGSSQTLVDIWLPSFFGGSPALSAAFRCL